MSPARSASLVVILAFSCLSAACTQRASEASAESRASVVAPSADDAGPPAPEGPRLVAVSANGTGCPNDATWEAVIAPDGQSVTLKLHAYDVEVNRGDAFQIEDCTIGVTIGDADGHQYTLGGFEASGWASLQGEGMRAEESIKYYLQGDPVASETRVKEHTSGPGSGYVFSEALAGENAVWSPCGGGRDLEIVSRKVLRNNPDKTGYGFIGGATLQLRLATRACQP